MCSKQENNKKLIFDTYLNFHKVFNYTFIIHNKQLTKRH